MVNSKGVQKARVNTITDYTVAKQNATVKYNQTNDKTIPEKSDLIWHWPTDSSPE